MIPDLFPQSMTGGPAQSKRSPGLIARITQRMFPYFAVDSLAGLTSTETSRATQELYFNSLSVAASRRARYKEYDGMDSESVVISSALDLYADNSTSGSAEGLVGKAFKVVSRHKQVAELLERTTRRLKLRQHVWAIARDLAKYGESIHEVISASPLTVDRIKPLSGDSMEKIVDKRGMPGKVTGARQGDEKRPLAKPGTFQWVQRSDSGQTLAVFADWQVCHWKLPTRPTDIYGSSILRTARRLHKQLQMSEDAMVIQRLLRAHMRYAFLIDTGKLPPNQAIDFVESVKQRMKKKPIFDTKTGKLKIENNPLTAEEDFWLPSGEKSQSDVKVLQGSAALTNISDIKYLVDLLFAAVKVPKAYLGFEAGTAGRHVINTLDVQFARVVRRIQYQLAVGLYQIFDTVLTLAGIDPQKYTYEIQFPMIGTEDELRRWQINQIRYGVASMIKGSIPIEGITDAWILRNIIGMDEDDIAALGIPEDQLTPGMALNMNSPLRTDQAGGGSGGGGSGFGGSGPKSGPNPNEWAYPGFGADVARMRWLIDWALASQGRQDVFGSGTTNNMAAGLPVGLRDMEEEAKERLKEALSA